MLIKLRFLPPRDGVPGIAVVVTARTMASAVGILVVVVAVMEMAVTKNTALSPADTAAKMVDTNNVNTMRSCDTALAV